jgi:hypothetical protein
VFGLTNTALPAAWLHRDFAAEAGEDDCAEA